MTSRFAAILAALCAVGVWGCERERVYIGGELGVETAADGVWHCPEGFTHYHAGTLHECVRDSNRSFDITIDGERMKAHIDHCSGVNDCSIVVDGVPTIRKTFAHLPLADNDVQEGVTLISGTEVIAANGGALWGTSRCGEMCIGQITVTNIYRGQAKPYSPPPHLRGPIVENNQ